MVLPPLERSIQHWPSFRFTLSFAFLLLFFHRQSRPLSKWFGKKGFPVEGRIQIISLAAPLEYVYIELLKNTNFCLYIYVLSFNFFIIII